MPDYVDEMSMFKMSMYITHYQRNANQNHDEVPSHTDQNGCYQKIYKEDINGEIYRVLGSEESI